MSNFKLEYMPKKETKPYKEMFNNLFKEIQKEFYDNLSLSYRLVGSSKRNLVIKHHNKGFDLDYQIIIQKLKNNLKAKEIKVDIMNFIRKKINSKHKNKYKIEDSKSAITIKDVDTDEGKIKVGFDIVIVIENPDYCEILRRKNNEYSFEILKEYRKFKENIRKIKKNCLWVKLRSKYKEDRQTYLTKNPEKKSFLILMESAKTIIDNLNN